VVGIGASAGGLAALRKFFSRVPEDTGLAFVVVVHLAPDHESHLAEVLQPAAKLPVQQVTQTVPIEADHVYLIPPNANLNAIDTHLRLSKLEKRREARAPIDHFFRTLARTHDGDAIGVVLTGTGSDGALGIKEIKAQGGLTIAQDPNDAEYDGMPQSAIATSFVDLVLPLQDIPTAILRYSRTEPQLEISAENDEVADEQRHLLQKLFALIQARTGRDFTRYKRSTILRRVTRRMQMRQVEELGGYFALLRSEPDEVTALAEDVLITVTNFFRDDGVFEKLAQDVIPQIFANKSRDDEVRVWAVGCATGEEAYSLAILLLEEAARREDAPRLQVFATDMHEASLLRAREGLYSSDIEADVSEERLRRFFQAENGIYRIRKEVREIVIFAPHNLLADPPFSRLDLITCRNLLIYLQREAQREVVDLFHYALRSGGFLVTGTSEAIEPSELFVAESKKECTYRRRDVPTPEPRLPVFPISHAPTPRGDGKPSQGREHLSYGEMHARLVEQFAPPSLLVSPNDTVAHLSEKAGRYLVHPGGEPTMNVFKLVRDEFQVELRAGLSEARRGQPIRSMPIPIRLDGSTHSVVLDIRPSQDPRNADFAIVIFDEADAGFAATTAPVADAATPLNQAGRERELETELTLLRQRLQSLIEEYDTGQEEMRASNEELQSANEELRSTLEELETSREELHSMNEELQTVNQENRHKVEELAQLSGDLQNFLAATDIATLFLDRELRILRFTPKVADLFRIRVADRSRPLSDLRHKLGYDELESDARQVLAKLIPIEREIEDEESRWYLTRMLPYRSTQDRIDGVVITFVDITARKRAEEALRRSEQRLAEELDTMVRLHELVGRLLKSPDLSAALQEVLDAAIDITNADMGSIQLLDPSAMTLSIAAQHGFRDDHLDHFRIQMIGDGSAASRALESRERVIVRDVEEGPRYAPHAKVAASASYRGMQASPLLSHQGKILGVLSTHYARAYQPSERDLRILDLYARQAAEFIERVQRDDSLREKTKLLEQEDERKEFFLATLGHELRNPLAALANAMKVIQEGSGDPDELHPMMAAQIEQLKLLINDLLEIARVTRGTITLRKSRTDLVRVVGAAAQSVKSSVQSKSQNLDLLTPESLLVVADETRMQQILVNLMSNASKFTPAHGHIEVVVARRNDQAFLSVRDEGCGLASADQEKIFEPFVQKDPRRGGLGIGLALVKRLVELHGGSIAVESEGIDRGATFTIQIPMGDVSREELPEIPPAPSADKLPSSTRVLIIDDSVDGADSLRMLLQLRGANARCAYTGAEGLERVRSWRPHIALVDIGLPDITGYDVAKQVRAEIGDEIVLIAMTGFGDTSAERSAFAAGFNEHLVKPVDHEQFYRILAEHVGRTRAPETAGPAGR
jgi:two-component system CheB/CheR fusion protein